jgi:hypothetical protein
VAILHERGKINGKYVVLGHDKGQEEWETYKESMLDSVDWENRLLWNWKVAKPRRNKAKEKCRNFFVMMDLSLQNSVIHS